jgi:hypothetical protein
MQKLAALFIAGALAAGAATQTFTGVITDTMCGKGHAMMNVTPDSKCVLECAQHDKNTKYAVFDGKNIYVLSDQKTPEQFAGQKVKVRGTLYEKTKILTVDSITADGPATSAPAHGSMPEMGHSGHQH